MNGTSAACVFEESYSISASSRDVWDALTDEVRLRAWFCEHAEIRAVEGGAYRFWGRHTPNFGAPVETTQRIVAIEAGRQFSFDWTWAGVATRCTITLRGSGGGTSVGIRHAFDGTIAHYNATVTGLIARDFWDVSMANLDAYLRVGAPALMVDHSYSAGRDVTLSIEIAASSDRVWAMLTEPERIARWLARDKEFPFAPEVDLRPGGRYSYGWKDEHGGPMGPSRIIEVEPGRRLVHDWRHEGDATERTEWTIESLAPDRTRLSVRQVGMGSAREFSGYASGWAGFLLLMRHQPASD